jgi:hypothetical protein
MQLNNTRQIRAEDFEKELQQAMGQLGAIVNSFMQEVVELSNGRIDFENRVENLKTIEITVDSNGKPILNDKVATGKTGIRGLQVIRALNVTNAGGFPTQQPFISFNVLAGGFIQITNISGLRPNEKYNLNIIIY